MLKMLTCGWVELLERYVNSPTDASVVTMWSLCLLLSSQHASLVYVTTGSLVARMRHTAILANLVGWHAQLPDYHHLQLAATKGKQGHA